MKLRFDKAYLYTTGTLLAIIATGKLLSLSVVMACKEIPIFGLHQPHGLTNRGVTGFATGMELAVVALICFSPLRWLPCLASALWGFACLVVRAFFIEDGAHCGCLGWLDAPAAVTCALAAWLAGGGWIAFRMAWRNPGAIMQPAIPHRTAAQVLKCITLSSIAAAFIGWGVMTGFNSANYSDTRNIFGPMLLAVAFPCAALGVVIAIHSVSLLRAGRKDNAQAVAA